MKDIMLEQIKDLEIFNGISKNSLEELMEKGEVKKYNSRSHIFRDKEDVKKLYIVLKGTVSLYKLNECGHKRVIFILGKGKMINDVIIQELPSSINCEAFEDAYILSYIKDDFLRIMERDFILSKNVICSLSMKVRRMYRQLKNSTGVIKMEKRLAAKLWKLSKDYGKECDNGILININITITYLSELLGSKRETISRVLKILSNKKLIEYKDKKILVIDQDKLSKFFKAP
ncbi:Crp/Fnr family transcriptional regulator [Clostridium weizhouense]|uniref:Crp/Fnr family transcriptional regulator n=1 Tax=Clostridium weizhouense TaxID=2859781 RepID=A0ABS7ASP9_9CLOT|nr:Crp/Fnr family transcriptional regulator [Clostridium weizhouense]MBW6411707.1 Crp/Fnr family transcriptional regulator [Clostridium weizhouense]